MVSGSVAVIVYGEPRLTHDVDLIVVLEPEHIAGLPRAFPPDEFYCPPLNAGGLARADPARRARAAHLRSRPRGRLEAGADIPSLR